MARIDIPAGEGGDAVMMWSLRPEMGRAVGRLTQRVYHDSILDVRVREAARIRIAQLNDCPVWLNFRAASLAQQGLNEDFYLHVGDAHATSEYSQREQLAIEYAERFALDHTNIDDDLFVRLRQHFTDPEILDLSICLAHFLGQGRLLRVLGIDQTCQLDV